VEHGAPARCGVGEARGAVSSRGSLPRRGRRPATTDVHPSGATACCRPFFHPIRRGYCACVPRRTLAFADSGSRPNFVCNPDGRCRLPPLSGSARPSKTRHPDRGCLADGGGWPTTLCNPIRQCRAAASFHRSARPALACHPCHGCLAARRPGHSRCVIQCQGAGPPGLFRGF
jgi:hypothetical protein